MSKLVLVIDDDPLIRGLVRKQLEAAGYDVLVAEDGASGMRVVREASPSIVITDWQMPGLDGLEVCRRIRDLDGFNWIYTLVLTGNEDTSQVVEAFEAGADDFLTKPFNRAELIARIRAGERIVDLQNDVARRELEISRRNAELEIAYQRLTRANRRLDEMATTDDLTGLSNRRAAMTALEQRWTEIMQGGGTMAMVLLDIDRFKSINDSYGHDVGDLVLVDVARALRQTTRASERIYRFGGEEFLLICPTANAGMARVAAERMRLAIERLRVRMQDGTTLSPTVSLGVADWQPGTSGHAEILKAADGALYEAKDSGRNRVVVAAGAGRVEDEDPPAEDRPVGPIVTVGGDAPPVGGGRAEIDERLAQRLTDAQGAEGDDVDLFVDPSREPELDESMFVEPDPDDDADGADDGLRRSA